MSSKFRRRRRGGCGVVSSFSTVRTTRLPILLLLATIASAQDANHYFCGTSWGDASDNCSERQHCPDGTDDECETEGHICFGGTTCDVRNGDGNKFKYANLPYEDISNTRFCGIDWAAAIDDCSLETHCPTGFSEECPDGQSCYGGLKCNVQDMLEEMEEEGGDVANKIGKHDPKRSNFCGTSWGDANGKCGIWCPEGSDDDCPGGLGCFGNTECYYDEDLVPTQTPVRPPSAAPSTIPPVAYKDPGNVRFCVSFDCTVCTQSLAFAEKATHSHLYAAEFQGVTWAMALANCAEETHCPSGSEKDCPKGQTCHGGLMDCNIIDLKNKSEQEVIPTNVPTLSPVSSDDPSFNKFCGKSWSEAEENCSLETHCPLDECPSGLICYGGIGCNAAEMTGTPTGRPTPSPSDSPTPRPTAPTMAPTLNPTTETRAPVTPAPTISPPPTPGPQPTPAPTIPVDDPRNSYWCGADWADVTKNCHEPCISGSDTDCPAGMTCIAFTPCRPKPKETPPPTRTPTTPDPTLPPSPPPSPNPVTDAPSGKPVDSTMAPAKGFDVFTMRPSSLRPTEGATESFTVAREEADEEDWADWYVEPDSTSIPATSKPSGKPAPGPSRNPTKRPSNPPLSALPPSTTSRDAPSHDLIAAVGSVLVAAGDIISSDILLTYNMATNEESPTRLYQYGGFVNALGVLSKGDMGSSYFYLGPNGNPSGANYGLANVAIFLAEAAIETVQFDICDEISWEKDVFSRYPISNSCGQGRFGGASMVSYEESNPCADNEAFMACPVDPSMTAVAKSYGIFVGAPPPLECRPKEGDGTGGWDPSFSCLGNGCSSYEGQRMGNVDPHSIPTANSFGRTDVEGCCWWGRGAFPRGSAGTCLIGKINYYLGKRALDEGRSSARYKDVDFCKDPSAICRGYYDDDKTNAEVRWLMGMLYWINKVQTYNVDGWSYLERLHSFVDGGMGDTAFLEDVSRIITRGCHDQASCGNAVMSAERREKFESIMDIFGRAQLGTLEDGEIQQPVPPPPSKRPTMALADVVPQPSPPTSRPTLRSASSFQSSPAPVDTSTNAADTSLSEESGAAEDDYKLTASELAQRLNFPNNYCASTPDEAQSKCAISLRTCNFGDPPCKPGLGCYGDIMCSIVWSDIELDSPAESPAESESAAESPSAGDVATSVIACKGMCLRPLSTNECVAGGDALKSLTSCEDVEIGELCENYVYCSDDAFHRNCPGGQNAFIRVLAEKCGAPASYPPTIASVSSSLPPTLNATPPSLKPTSSIDYDSNSTTPGNNTSYPPLDSVGWLDSDTGLAEEKDDSGPGAWWKWYDKNGAAGLCAMPVLSLISIAAALVLNGMA